MELTKKEAKELTIEVWTEIIERGLTDKYNLCRTTMLKLKGIKNKCPLCHLYNRWDIDDFCDNCEGCPLKEIGQQCENDEETPNYYEEWLNNEDFDSAQELLNAVKAWDVED